MFRFKCSSCADWHTGIPAFAATAPTAYEAMEEEERRSRSLLDEDACIIDGDKYFIRGLIEISVEGCGDPLTWNLWASVNATAFQTFVVTYEQPKRAHIDPLTGLLATELLLYPGSQGLGLQVHLRDDGFRPIFTLDPCEHPLVLEQRLGISQTRLAAIIESCLH